MKIYFKIYFLGEFARVRSHTQGEAFNLTLDFDTPFRTTPGFTYVVSMYTLINCPKVGCEAGQDTLSVKIEDGDSGIYRQIYLINRIRDQKWNREVFNFVAAQNKTYVSTLNSFCFFFFLKSSKFS